MELIRPHRLRPGDPVRVVAASGPVDREKFEAGVAALGDRYRLVYDEATLFARDGFLAGGDDQRLGLLNHALRDRECRGVILARGGYGLTRILAGIDRQAMRAWPKAVVGYSDVTALLTASARARVAAIHGPMVSDLGTVSDGDLAALVNLLENPDPGVVLGGMETLVGGRAEGHSLGGNLEVLSRLLGTAEEPDFDGAVLFFEEVGEAPYRVDRLLTHLEMAGVFERVAGIVVGELSDCDEVEDGVVVSPTARDVLEERLGRVAVPVVLGGAFGHGQRKRSLPCAVQVELDADRGELRAIEGAVS